MDVDLKATMPPRFICQGTADQICDVHIEGETCITYITVIEGQVAVYLNLRATVLFSFSFFFKFFIILV